MQEQMALEGLIVEWLGTRLNTALKQVRYRLFRPSNHSYSDLDAVASSPIKGTLAIAESKLQGPARAVYAVNSRSPILTGQLSGYAPSLKEGALAIFAKHNEWVSPDLQMGEHDRPWRKLRHLELWLVANVFYDPGDRDAVDARFTDELRTNPELVAALPQNVTLSAYIRSTIDVIIAAFEQVESTVVTETWGARFGHSQLDLLREIVRYKHAQVANGGMGRSAACIATFAQAVNHSFIPK